MRAFGLSYEKVKKSSLMANALKRRLLNTYNNFKRTCCKINDAEQRTKKYYKCSSFKRDSSCPTKIYLLFHASNNNNNFEVTLFQAIKQHDHTTENKQTGILIEVKNVIIELF